MQRNLKSSSARQRDECVSSSSSGAHSPKPTVAVVTPDRKEEMRRDRRKRQRETEKRKEAKLVRMLMERRLERSYSDSCQDDSPVANVSRRLFPSEAQTSEDLESIDAPQPWASSVIRMRNMAASFWWSEIQDLSREEDELLSTVVGHEDHDLDRFRLWSMWNSETLKFNPNTDKVSEVIRWMMWSLSRSDVTSFKTIVFTTVDKDILSQALTTQFGKLKRTILHAIAIHPSVDAYTLCLRALVSRTVHVNSDVAGLSPLHLLALNSSLQRGPTVEIFDRLDPSLSQRAERNSGSLPLHLFTLSDHARMQGPDLDIAARVLSKNSTGQKAFSEQRTSLMTAIRNPNVTTCMHLTGFLATGFAVIATDAHGYMPLHVACMYGRYEILEALIPKIPRNEKFRPCTSQGTSPMHAAAAGGTAAHAECIRLLIELVPHSEILAGLKDNEKWPPLLYALFAGTTETIKACIEADEALVDPTWGPAPQLLSTLELARKQKQRFDTSSEKDDRIEKLLHALVTVPEFFGFINRFLEGGVSRLAGPLGFILDLPMGSKLLTIENKVRYLEYRCMSKTRAEGKPASCKLYPPRPDLLNKDSCVEWLGNVRELLQTQRFAKGQRLEVRFIDENGFLEEGYGIGPTREFFSVAADIIVKHLFVANPNSQWLLPTDDNAKHDACKAAGMVVALSLVSASRIELSRIYKSLWEYIAEGDIGYIPDVEKLTDWDADLARSLKFIAENDIDQNEDIHVVTCGENKFKFIAAQVNSRLFTDNLRRFREGFFDVFEEEWIVDFFDMHELAVVFGASDGQEINVTDWEKHTNYSSGYRTCDHQISWFWDLIRALPDNERRLVLLFVTGMTAPPLGGFASLTTSGGDLMPFTIMRVECLKTESPLPTAATCFNLLKLPAYPNREMLNEKVLTGIRFGSHGFNFA